MKGFIVYATYETQENKTFIHLFGRLENDQSFVAVVPYSPHFYIKSSDRKKLPKSPKYTLSTSDFTTFSQKPVIKISTDTKADLTKITESLHKKADTFEADLKPHYAYLINNDILGSINIEGEYENSQKIDRIYHNPEITPTQFNPQPKLISIDTESDKKGKLFCIGITSHKYKKNFYIGKTSLKNAVLCKTEEECLLKFKEELLQLDPDIITGWNVIDFDLGYLRKLFHKHNIPFDIGRNNSSVKIKITNDFFRASTADIPGRIILDGMNLIKDPIIKNSPTLKNAKLDSFSLESVSQALLGKGKLLKGKDRHTEIERLYHSSKKDDNQKLVDYNILDCELAYDLLIKTNILNLALERAQLTGMPLDRLTGSIAAFDSLYIRHAHKKKLVSPTTRFSKKEERITGGYVRNVKPGIYQNVLVLDFKSLYPSIIKTFNIDPASFLKNKKKNAIESPNKAYFKNTEGVLPEIITSLHEARERAKKEGRELSTYAIKIIMNSFFGVLASPNCRYFNLDIANAITHFGQHLIKLTAKEIEKKGYSVMYSDTDSVFVETKSNKTKANAIGKDLEKYINDFYKTYIKKKYKRESFLELEFEKQYIALMLPKTRGQETGAKKRYAGLIEKNNKEILEIIGLEAIRGDWTEAAQNFQKEILKKTFKNKPIQIFIKNYIKEIREGKRDKELIYKKSLRKNLDEYVKTTPPHVKAARKLPKLNSTTIRYYITTDGPEPVEHKKHHLDYDHYIEKQIKPIAQQILVLLNKDFDTILEGSTQKKLF